MLRDYVVSLTLVAMFLLSYTALMLFNNIERKRADARSAMVPVAIEKGTSAQSLSISAPGSGSL